MSNTRAELLAHLQARRQGESEGSLSTPLLSQVNDFQLYIKCDEY